MENIKKDTRDNGKVMLYGDKVCFDACVLLMDDEIRERIHSNIRGTWNNQRFINSYASLHLKKYNKKFEV